MNFKNFIDYYDFHPEVVERLILVNDIIDESFNWDKTEVQIVTNLEHKVALKFDYRDLSYLFSAYQIIPKVWDIQYSLIGRPEFTENDLFRRLESGEINNKVLAAVLRCIKEFIKLKSPERITFSSSDERLIYFYDILVSQFERKLSLKLEKREVKKENNFSVSWIYMVKHE